MTIGKRIAIIAALIVTGLLLLFDPRGPVPWPMVILASVLFVAAIAVAAVAFRSRSKDDELERSFEELEGRWEEIEAALQAAASSGQSPVRALAAIGIKGLEQRKFIMQKLRGDEETTPTAETGPGPQPNTPSAAILRKYTDGNGPSPTRPWGTL